MKAFFPLFSPIAFGPIAFGLFLPLTLTLFSCAHQQDEKRRFSSSPSQAHRRAISGKIFEVMAYNVENLFDTLHDSAKNDYTFLPYSHPQKKEQCQKVRYFKYRRQCFRTDWNEEKLNLKIKQIVKVLTSRPRLPDFLALMEVENEKVLSLLAKKLGFAHFVITGGSDRRGIEVALLYRDSPLIKKIAHRELVVQHPRLKKWPTRNILEVDFLIDKKYRLSIFVNHWPSLGNPTSTRLAAARVLRRRTLEKRKIHPNLHIISLGDYNTIAANSPHPFKTLLFKDNLLRDVHELFLAAPEVPAPAKEYLPRGTYFYKRQMIWNVLDRILIGNNLMDGKGLETLIPTYEIYAPPLVTTSFKYRYGDPFLIGRRMEGIPKGYDFSQTLEGKQGFSDHFPIAVKIAVIRDKVQEQQQHR